MSGYTPLFSSIVTSTVWLESHETVRVWVTIMALKDQDGLVDSSIPGLATTARVTIEECKIALEKFLAPDPYSRTKEHEGRRIEEVPGGWRVLNHDIYKKKVKSRAEYYRERRARLKQEAQQLRNTPQQGATPPQRSATPPTTTSTSTPTPTNDQLEPPKPPKKKKRGRKSKYEQVLDVPIPDEINTEEVVSWWHRWIDHRATTKHGAMTPLAAEIQLEELAKLGPARAIASIKKSISCNYADSSYPKERGSKQRGLLHAGAHKPDFKLKIDPNWKPEDDDDNII